MGNYVQAETEREGREGKYGKVMQKFFEENPLGTVNIYNTVAVCPVCREFREVYDLTMYIPKKKGKDFWKIADEKYDKERSTEYVKESAPRDFSYENHIVLGSLELDVFYDKYMEYEHHCPDCGSIMKLIPYFNKYLIDGKYVMHCPKCNGVMKSKEIGYRD